jgi:hypothetical protein
MIPMLLRNSWTCKLKKFPSSGVANACRFENTEEPVMTDVRRMLLEGFRSTKQAISLGDMGLDRDEDELSLAHLTKVMARSLSQKRSASLTDSLEDGGHKGGLPKVITFPYSRHSSYDELCDLVRIFMPKDVYPCTVDEENWHEGLLDHLAVLDNITNNHTKGISVRSLFGHHCSTSKFRHDWEMRELLEDRALIISQQTHTTLSAQSSPFSPDQRSHSKRAICEPTVVGRNAQDRLRPFDGNSREVTRQYSEVSAEIENIKTATIPRNISAVSPNSESQNLRRKAIQEGVAPSSAKRARLQYDGPDSSPVPGSAEISHSSRQPGLNMPGYPETFDDDNVVDTLRSEAVSNQNTTAVPQNPPYSAFHDETGGEILYDFDEWVPR